MAPVIPQEAQDRVIVVRQIQVQLIVHLHHLVVAVVVIAEVRLAAAVLAVDHLPVEVPADHPQAEVPVEVADQAPEDRKK